jgi:hypothetical protein
MRETMRRVEVLDEFVAGRARTTYPQTTAESMCLQIRKVLEIIAYSSLVSHRQSYVAVRKNFARDWHANRIIAQVAQLNPDFYPRPIVGFGALGPNYVRGGYLTRTQFEQIYERCGALLHAKNPFGVSKSVSAFSRSVPQLITRIKALLQEHVLQLMNSTDLIWVVMPFDSDTVVVQHLERKSP